MKNIDEQKIYKYFWTLKESTNAGEREKSRQELLEIDQGILVNYMKARIDSEKDIEVLAYMAETIVERKVEDAASLILPLAHSEDPSLRRHICGLLGNCADKIAFETLIDRLRTDTSADVRVVAAYALGKIRDTRAITDLIWAKEHDFAKDFDGRSVSQQAGEALKEIGY